MSEENIGRIGLRAIAVFACIAVLLSARSPAQAPPVASRTPDAYLYIEPFLVRQEILVSLRTLETLLPVTHADPGTITVAEQQAAAETVELFFAVQNPVRIDGIPVRPVATTVAFLDGDNIAFGLAAEPVDLAADRTLVGIINTFSTKGAFDSVGMTWNSFGGTVHTVRCTIYDGGDSRRATLTESEPDIHWSGTVSQGFPPLQNVPAPRRKGWFGRGIDVSGEQAREVLAPLLRNIYRAFDYRAESDVYDALAQSAGGDLLTPLYLEIRRSLELESEGGPVSRVEEVVIESVAKLGNGPDDGFRADATWTVRARVEHWGHVHVRTNRYTARFDVLAADERWRIAAFDVLDQQRVETWTRPREDTSAIP